MITYLHHTSPKVP
jgi:bifunctional Delta-12/omega-3 fatty acid desaturase